jgi:hypothetical protein
VDEQCRQTTRGEGCSLMQPVSQPGPRRVYIPGRSEPGPLSLAGLWASYCEARARLASGRPGPGVIETRAGPRQSTAPLPPLRWALDAAMI